MAETGDGFRLCDHIGEVFAAESRLRLRLGRFQVIERRIAVLQIEIGLRGGVVQGPQRLGLFGFAQPRFDLREQVVGGGLLAEADQAAQRSGTLVRIFEAILVELARVIEITEIAD